MIETQTDKANASTTIVLKPNNSASWRFNMQLTAALATVLFIISTYFALPGLWMIFLFAGLEIILLIACQYIRLRANQSSETITVNSDDILVKRCCYQKVEPWK
jgi:uncharacterized membrane protein